MEGGIGLGGKEGGGLVGLITFVPGFGGITGGRLVEADGGGPEEDDVECSCCCLCCITL